MQAPIGLHWPSLLVAIVLMLLGSIAPIYLADSQGQADHGLALLAFWAMSAGFVRGVGFIPQARLWRWLLSGRACGFALISALLLRFFAS